MSKKVRKFRSRGQTLPLVILALLLTGCDNDRPVSDLPSPPPPTASAAPQPDAQADASGTGASSAPNVNAPPDPLLGTSSADQTPPNPLLASDPLATGDPLKGPVMPTQHSHWLDVEMGQARIAIRLNGVRLGGYAAPGTRDITMRLRPGVNVLTVTYEPRTRRSWASVVVTEGENGPAGHLLASFRQAPLAPTASQADASQAPPPVIKTLVFTAK